MLPNIILPRTYFPFPLHVHGDDDEEEGEEEEDWISEEEEDIQREVLQGALENIYGGISLASAICTSMLGSPCV